MSNVLAIAAVTHLLKDLLNNALIDGDVSQALGSDFTVTARPPDLIVAENGADQSTNLNLFLHRITPNAALRNMDLPTRSGDGHLLQRPRLAIDLHYILTAVASEELHAEILLGYAMHLFHEVPMLPRETIRAALQAAVIDEILPAEFDPIRASELADQIELLKITPHTLSMDYISQIWTALQASYRTTVAYDVSVVLIERELPSRPTLPVLSRGGPVDPETGRDPGVLLRGDLLSTVPTLSEVAPADGQPVMRLGGEVILSGHALDLGEATVRFTEPGSRTLVTRAPRTPVTPTCLRVRLPDPAPLAPGNPLQGTGADPAAWRIGSYVVSVHLVDEDGREIETNGLPLALAPAVTVAAEETAGVTEVTVTSAPVIREDQSVAVLVGTRMAVIAPPTAATDTVTAELDGLAAGQEIAVRLRVDGIDSPVVNRATDPPSLDTVTVS